VSTAISLLWMHGFSLLILIDCCVPFKSMADLGKDGSFGLSVWFDGFNDLIASRNCFGLLSRTTEEWLDHMLESGTREKSISFFCNDKGKYVNGLFGTTLFRDFKGCVWDAVGAVMRVFKEQFRISFLFLQSTKIPK